MRVNNKKNPTSYVTNVEPSKVRTLGTLELRNDAKKSIKES